MALRSIGHSTAVAQYGTVGHRSVKGPRCLDACRQRTRPTSRLITLAATPLATASRVRSMCERAVRQYELSDRADALRLQWRCRP